MCRYGRRRRRTRNSEDLSIMAFQEEDLLKGLYSITLLEQLNTVASSLLLAL
jgi:hypothetical protein